MKTDGIKNYLEEKIANWYAYAKADYGVDGRLLDVKTDKEHLLITWKENGEKFLTTIGWYEDYTLEQIYDIWQMGCDGAGVLCEKVA